MHGITEQNEFPTSTVLFQQPPFWEENSTMTPSCEKLNMNIFIIKYNKIMCIFNDSP